jgi:hypothetical protein
VNAAALRVLNLLRSHGSLTPRDFRHPTIDGGDEMERLAARINEIRGEGHNVVTSIEVTPNGKRYARYTLQGEAASGVSSSTSSSDNDVVPMGGLQETSEPTPLFEVPHTPTSHYGDAA